MGQCSLSLFQRFRVAPSAFVAAFPMCNSHVKYYKPSPSRSLGHIPKWSPDRLRISKPVYPLEAKSSTLAIRPRLLIGMLGYHCFLMSCRSTSMSSAMTALCPLTCNRQYSTNFSLIGRLMEEPASSKYSLGNLFVLFQPCV